MFSPYDLFIPENNRSRKKSHGGCKTCKSRKVKCDELHPVCSNCKVYFSNRTEKCDYDFGARRRSTRPKTQLFGTTSSRDHARVSRSERTLSPFYSSEAPVLLPKTVGALALDPFDTQAKSGLPSAKQLTYYYLSDIICRCVPLGHTPETSPFAHSWWPLVQADAFLYHVVLQVSAFELEWRRGIPNTFHSEAYARECIRLLKDRVENSVSGISDQTIAAVATLASIEYFKGNMMAMKIHIQGLKQMVKLRGGLRRVRSSSPTTANATFWFSMVMTSESQFPPEDGDESPDQLRLLTDAPPLSETSNHLDFNAFGVEKTVSNLMIEIRYLCLVFSHKTLQRNDAVSSVDVHSIVNSIGQRLLHIQPLASMDPGSSNARITESCKFAALLFLFLPFENHWPDPTLIINSFLHKLKSAICSLVPGCGIENQLHVWLLAVGGAVAVSLPEREWFVSHLVAVAADLELKCWDDMERCLERVIWIEDFDDGRFHQLWKDMKRASESMAMQDPFSGIRYFPRVLERSELDGES